MLEDREKKLIYFAAALVIIFIIILLVIIWKPLISNIYNNELNKFDSNINYDDMMKDYYIEYASTNLNIDNFDTLYEKISKSYIDSIGINDKEGLKTYLRDQRYISSNITIYGVEYSNFNNKSMYRIRYAAAGNERYVNIVENSPYDFSVNFENSNYTSLINKSINQTREGVTYKIEVTESSNNSIRVKATITNNSDNTYEFNFSALNSFQIIYDNKYINLAAVANSSTTDYRVTSGGTITYEGLFNMSLANQFKISGYSFNGVVVDGEKQNIKIEL